jgi:hypothetical protein
MFDLYFRMFDLAGLKCEPGFGELVSPAGDAIVSARQYHSKGVTAHDTKPGALRFIDVTQACSLGSRRARPANNSFT